MIGNQTVTIFHSISDREWKVFAVGRCMWCGVLGKSSVSKGEVQSDTYTVLLPINETSTAIAPGDVLILGDRSAEFSDQCSRRELLSARDSLTVASVTVHPYGSARVRHVEVRGV